MFKVQRDIFEEVLGRDRAHTAARDRFNRNLSKLYRDYVLRLKDFIAHPDRFSESERMDMAAAQRVVEQLTPMLVDAGLEDTISVYLDQFPPLTREALKYFRKYGDVANLAGVDRGALEGFISYGENTLRQQIERRFVAPVQDAIFQAAFGRADFAATVDHISSLAADMPRHQLETMVSDSYQQYLRTVTTEKAESLEMDVYVYVGPLDGKTSEQCEALLTGNDYGVPGLYLREDINASMVEGLTGDPLIAGGHPNCRHEFVPLTREEARRRGAKV